MTLTQYDINLLLARVLRFDYLETWWADPNVFGGRSPSQLWEEGLREEVAKKVISYFDFSYG